MQKITMHTSRTYDILIEDGLLASAAELIAEMRERMQRETRAVTSRPVRARALP